MRWSDREENWARQPCHSDIFHLPKQYLFRSHCFHHWWEFSRLGPQKWHFKVACIGQSCSNLHPMRCWSLSFTRGFNLPSNLSWATTIGQSEKWSLWTGGCLVPVQIDYHIMQNECRACGGWKRILSIIPFQWNLQCELLNTLATSAEQLVGKLLGYSRQNSKVRVHLFKQAPFYSTIPYIRPFCKHGSQ